MGRHRRSTPELPDEIISKEILLRLPASSLRRFKLVCRKWRDIISDPNFIHTHLHHLNQQPSSSEQLNVLIINKGKLYSRTIKSNILSSIQVARNRLPHTKWFKRIKDLGPWFLGSCNGLICLRTYYLQMGFWNPCTGSYRAIEYFHCLHSSSSGFGYDASLGFGYDAYTKDFKLVEINGKKTNRNVRVFSLNSNSWKTISDTSNFPVEWDAPGKFIDGVLYWVNFKVVDRALCFDIHDEVFSELSLPDVSPEDKCKIEISDIGGCIALARELNRKFLEVWVMKESWIKMYSVDVSSCSYRFENLIPFGGINVIRRKNEKKENHVDRVIYVGKYWHRLFFSFDPSTNQFSSFPFPNGASYPTGCESIITYVESLVSVNPEKRALPS